MLLFCGYCFVTGHLEESKTVFIKNPHCQLAYCIKTVIDSLENPIIDNIKNLKKLIIVNIIKV